MRKLLSVQNSKDLSHKIYSFLGLKFKIKNNSVFEIDYEKALSAQNFIKQKIDIIIPVYNGYEYLEDLFQTIYDFTDLEYELFVVDDCSTDKKVAEFLNSVKDKFKNKLHLYKNERNLGFLKTVNFAMGLCKNDIVLINTDVKLPPNWASRLMAPIFKNKKIASVTPFSNAATIFSFPDIYKDNAPAFEYDKIDEALSILNFDELPLLEFPTGVGFCMAMSRDALNKVGFFDEKFKKGYGEENDWCMRALKQGFINTFAPNLFVYHRHGGSFDSEEKKTLCEENLKIITDSYPDYLQLVKAAAKNPYYLKIRFLAFLLYSYKFAENIQVKFNKPFDKKAEKNDLFITISKNKKHYIVEAEFQNTLGQIKEKDLKNIVYLLSCADKFGKKIDIKALGIKNGGVWGIILELISLIQLTVLNCKIC